MRSIPKLVEDEIFMHERTIRAKIAEFHKEEGLSVPPQKIYELLLGLPDLFRILTDILISDNFNDAERYAAAYAFSYLVNKEDYIPDTTSLQIGYLDDLLVCSLIVKKIHDSGSPARFSHSEIRAKPMGDFLSAAHDLQTAIVPGVIYTKIQELLKPLLA